MLTTAVLMIVITIKLTTSEECMYEPQLDECVCTTDGLENYLTCNNFPKLTHLSPISTYTTSIFLWNLIYNKPVTYSALFWPKLNEIYDEQNTRIPCYNGVCKLNNNGLDTNVDDLQTTKVYTLTSNTPNTSKHMGYVITTYQPISTKNGVVTTSHNKIVTLTSGIDSVSASNITNIYSEYSTDTGTRPIPTETVNHNLTSGTYPISTTNITRVNSTNNTHMFSRIFPTPTFQVLLDTKLCNNLFKIGFYVILGVVLLLLFILIFLIFIKCYKHRNKRYEPSNQIEMETI